MPSFTLTLPNEKVGTHRAIIVGLIVANLLAFTYYNLVHRLSILSASGIGDFLALLSFLIFLRQSRGLIKLKRHRALEILMVLISLCWMLSGQPFTGICQAAFAIFLFFLKPVFVIVVSEKGVAFPSFPSRLIDWSELDNAVLKDGVLTLDFKNNRLFQSLLTRDCIGQINEQEFSDFCSGQILSASRVT